MKKQFKTESKKLLDMMVNSIYTHKEIFLRELISNASDAIDKLYFRSLTDSAVTVARDEYEIRLSADKAARTLTITDNGCGMTKDELESNLGTIAKSGSFEFKKGMDGADKAADVDVIGQFGVGFYSAFMVSDRVTVDSRAYGADEAFRWESSGADGYTLSPVEKDAPGTVVTLHLKDDSEDESYSDYLEEWQLRSLVRKYSDYVRYPIRMQVERSRKKEDSPEDKPEYESYLEDETLNSMIPIWKKERGEVTDEEYASFYEDKFFDYEAPLLTVRQKNEGSSEYVALLFVPARAPYDYYTRDYEKGLALYSSGVMIMDKCKDLLPDYFSFVRGLVDSSDLSLNISRELLQHDRQLKAIAKGIEKKIASELAKLLGSDREKYEQFFKAFGRQLKFGLYSDYGAHKDVLKDLILFTSSKEDKPVTLKEYTERMGEEQKKIFYAPGETLEQIKLLPQVEAVLAKGYEVLFLTEDVDEFALQILHEYDGKEFSNVCRDDLDLGTDEEKAELKTANDVNAAMLTFLRDQIGAVSAVRFTNSLKNHPACLSTEGEISVEMEKTLNKMPGVDEAPVKAELVLEINLAHPIADTLRELYNSDLDKLGRYAKILYAQARLISGLSLENPGEIGDMVVELMV